VQPSGYADATRALHGLRRDKAGFALDNDATEHTLGNKHKENHPGRVIGRPHACTSAAPTPPRAAGAQASYARARGGPPLPAAGDTP